MVEVRFACIPSVAGVRCTLDGVTKLSDESGIASFFGITQGEHTYSVEAPSGMYLLSGEDVFGRPLGSSGTTIIEWLPIPGTPWPEDQPWMMLLNFEVGEEPPAEVPWIAVAALSVALGIIIFGLFIAPIKWPR